jgi:hypothetical protein
MKHLYDANVKKFPAKEACSICQVHVLSSSSALPTTRFYDSLCSPYSSCPYALIKKDILISKTHMKPVNVKAGTD